MTNASIQHTPNTKAAGKPAQALADIQQWFSVQSFLVFEARLLDDYQLEPWLDLLTDDIRYWMPLVTNRIGRDVGQKSVASARSRISMKTRPACAIGSNGWLPAWPGLKHLAPERVT